MATELAHKIVRFWITNAAHQSKRDHDIVRFYLDTDPVRGKMCRFRMRQVPPEPTQGAFTNITFLYNNLFDSATVTASSAHRKFSVSDIQDIWGTRAWRSYAAPYGDPLASQWVKADLGSAQNVKAFLVWYHNFYRNADVKIQANAADAWGGPTIDESIVLYNANYPIVKLWNTAKSFQWWRIPIDGDWSNIITEGDFNEARVYLDYARIGRVFLGDYFRPESNFNRAYVISESDDSEVFPTLEGQTVANVTPRYKRIAYEFEDLSAADYAKFITLWNTVGETTPFWIVQNAGRWYDQTFYVTLAGELSSELKPGTEKYDLRMVVEEVS